MKPDKAVKDIMTKEMVTIFPDATFNEVKNIFKKNDFHHIPVVSTDNTLVGIISKIDWLKKAQYLVGNTSGKTYSAKYLQGLTAKEWMTPDPVTLSPDDTIGLAADIIVENKYHALPITEDGKLVGIITSHDLIAFAFYKTPVGNNI